MCANTHNSIVCCKQKKIMCNKFGNAEIVSYIRQRKETSELSDEERNVWQKDEEILNTITETTDERRD